MQLFFSSTPEAQIYYYRSVLVLNLSKLPFLSELQHPHLQNEVCLDTSGCLFPVQVFWIS